MDDLDRLLARYDPIPDWPNCDVADCGNKVCTWGHRTLCWAHAKDDVGESEMNRRYDLTHLYTMAWSEQHPDATNWLVKDYFED